MPIYKYNGQTYDIPDNVVSDFEKKRPDATIAYQVDGNIYDIPLAKREGFLSKYPSASLYQEKVEQAKEIDPFQPESVAKPLYTDFSYQESVANQENSQYYPSPLNEEGRAETEPMSYEDRSRQEYEMLMRQLEEFDAQNKAFMDEYEERQKTSSQLVGSPTSPYASDPNREYLDANYEDYRGRLEEKSKLIARRRENPYYQEQIMSGVERSAAMADSLSEVQQNLRRNNPEMEKEIALWRAQAASGAMPRLDKPISQEALDYRASQADLRAAEKLYREAEETYAAPFNDGEYVFKRFGQGFVDPLNEQDFWTMGITKMVDNVNAREAFQKIQDKFGTVKLEDISEEELDALLTPSEKILVAAVMDNLQAQMMRKDDTSGAYKAGQGAADSAMFMAQFLITGGAGTAAQTAISEKLAAWLGKNVATSAVGKFGIGTVSSIGKALVMTPMMPQMYVNISDKLMSFDKNGELVKATDAVFEGAMDSLIETWSESTGDFVEKVLGVPGEIAKRGAKKFLKNVPLDDWGKAMNAPLMKILRRGGFNGFLGEMGEEFIGNAVRSITGLEPDAFKEFVQLENLFVTAGSFAPMTVLGMGGSAVQYGWSKRKLENAQKAFGEMLTNLGYTEDQVRFAIDELLATTDAHLSPQRLAENFTPFLREIQANDRYSGNKGEAYGAALDFMVAIAKHRAMDGVYHRTQEQQRADMQSEIQQATGREFWTTRLSNRVGADGTAYETNEVEYVEFQDGRVAYVLSSDGVTNTVVYNDGTTGFLSNEQLDKGKNDGSIVSHEKLGLNDYLAQQVIRVRMTEEEQRMFAERNTNIGQVRAQFPIDATVELGTTEAPIQGIVRQQTPNGVIVESPAGVSQLTWEELGHTIGIEVNPQTDAQMEEEAINNLEIADLQRRRAREQRRAQRNAAAEAVLTEEQMVDEAENEGLEKPIPMKADGTVDQTAFWNESPARWAQWKTEQRQDGGAYASTYIQNAIGILEGQIAESEAAFLAESDFDAKDALEQTINQQRARLAELQDLAMQYTPAVIPAETSAEAPAEQTQPGAETSQPAVMADRQKFELDAEYQRRLSLARALAEKEMILKEYFEAISAGSMEAVVMNKQNYKQVMKDNGCDEAAIERVTKSIKIAEEVGQAVSALHANDKIFVIAEYNYTVENGRVSYVHERQHNITKRNPELIQRVLSLGLSRETLQKIVRTLSGTAFYDNESDEVLADEILSSTMEIAYTFDDFSVTLSKLGLPIELINLINQINDEQRNDFTLANARRNAIQYDNSQDNSGQNVRDQGEVSGGILGEEGDGPLGDSDRRAEARGEGERRETSVAEVDEESEEGSEAPSSRITSEMDEAYLRAVEAGDMETAQRMVIEAARLAMPNTRVVDENGNPLVVYHGTNAAFTEFQERHIGSLDPGYFGRGFYFTPDRSVAEGYAKGANGNIIMGVFLDISNPIETDMNNTNLFGDRLEGHDGVIVRLGEGGIAIDNTNYDPNEIAEIVAKNANQIKSADPVTYDDAGNVIPLSQRFNPESSDIRFRTSADTRDSNGVTAEQIDEINRSVGGELEIGDEDAPVRFSVTAIGEGAGLTILKDDGEGNVAFVLPDGRRFNANNLLKPEDIKSLPNTVLGYMMKDAKSLGNVDSRKEWMLWNKYTLMLNAILLKGSAENGGFDTLSSQWQWIGDTIYKTVAINSDSQYSFSLDITRVCKKNEAVINAIAEMQARLGYGITPGQIMDIYLTTSEEGYQVPCPVCYVFSRYIRNGKYATIMINGQRKYGSELVDPRSLTPEQRKERIKFWQDELKRIKDENKAHSKEIAKANSDITTLLDEIDKIAKELTNPENNFSEEEKAQMMSKIYELDARYKAALNVVSQASLDSWITQFAIHKVKVDGKEQWVLYEDSYMGFPEEMALDLRQTSTVMRKYPAIQRFRNSRGAAAGKEITFVANNDLGDVPLALGSSAATKDLAKPREMSDEEWNELQEKEYAELKLGVKNLYQRAVEEKDPKKKKKLLESAKKRFAAASIYAKQQSLRGGQRMWSWSDNIERLAPDVFVNLLQLEMLGGALQSYSKQLEGIKLVASMNGYVNGSLMGKGNGYREVTAEQTEEVDGQLYLKDGDFMVAEPGKKPFVLKTPVYQHTDGKLYVLEFDDVVGIDPFGKEVDGKHMKGLFELNAEYDRAGNIIVGMNDLHIRMCMADDRIFFIIPWHSSGANSHILAQMYEYLGVEYDVKLSQDYTDVQSEKRYKAPTEAEEETDSEAEEEVAEEGEEKKTESNKISQFLVDFWNDHYENAREYAGYGAVAGKDFACGIEGGVEPSDGNGNLSASQIHYRELRDAIFVGVKVPNGVDKNGKAKTKTLSVEEYSEEWFNEIMNDAFLSQVYTKVRALMGDKGMTSADTKAIYPYEYWDESSTYDTADINGARYLEYCRRLGYKPKFCGKLDGKPESDHGNFTDDKGYWKVLIDRRMYAISGRFQDLTPVTADNFTPDLVDPEVTKEEFIVTRVADEAGTQTIVDKAIAREESRPGGIAKVDYDMTLNDALEVYNNGDVRMRVSSPSGVIDLVEEAKKAQAKHDAKESDVRFRVLDTSNAELKEKPIKLNGMYRFNLKNAFKGVKDNGGSYPYIKVQLEEVSDDYSGEKIEYDGILAGFAVVRIPKGLITEGEKDNVFFIDPKAIENELWDVLRATENYYEFKHGNAPYQRDWMNADEVRFRVRTEEEREKLFEDAKEQYGVTDNFNIAGYMLPDGSLLNFADKEGEPNIRGIDHRNIGSIINDREYESRWDYITDFLNEGAIRLMPESDAINLSVKPSEQQREKLLDYFYKKNGYIILELADQNGNSVSYMEYDRGTSPYRIMRDIDGYFNDGIVPQQDVRFRMRGENESIQEFFESAVSDYQAKYTELGTLMALPVDDITAMRFGFTLEQLQKINGLYEPGTDIIAIFAHKRIEDTILIENTIFHEDIHYIASFYPHMDKLGKWLMENADIVEAFAEIRDEVETYYEESKRPQEMLCRIVSLAMTTGTTSELDMVVPYELQNIVRQIENEIGYDRGTEESSRKAQWLAQHTGSEEGSEPSAREHPDGRRSDEETRFRTTEITPEVQEEMDAIHASAILMGNFMKAPNGKDTNLTEEQWLMVRTKNFRDWFGDWLNDPENASKVVDENGEPRVVYHGTAGNIDRFENQQRAPGFWFVDREDVANGYAESASVEFGEDKNVIPVFLNIRNPRTEDAYGEFPAEFALKSYVENDNGVYQEFDTYEEAEAYRKENVPDGWVGASKVGDQHDLVERAVELGHDGVIMKNMHDQAAYAETRVQGTQTNYVVLSPSQIKSATDNTGEYSEGEGDIRFSIRTKPAPKKTGKGYKVFYLKDGKLYPPMVANLGGVDTPVLVWLDADAAPQAATSKTGRKKVKAGGKGTQGGSGTLAYRPGWHLGEIPYALQFNRGPKVDNPLGITGKNGKVIKVGKYFPADFVWAEVEYANEVDYQDEAMSYGYNEAGNFQHSLAGLPKVPEDGSYIYRTNANPATDPWIITGAMKVTRLLTPSEVDKMVIDAGRKPQERQEGAVTDAQIEALNKELGLVEEEEEVSFRTTGTPTEDVVAEGVSLSPAQLASLAGDIFAALPEDVRKKITDGLNGNILGLQDAILQIPTSLATKEEWNDEDRQMAEVVAEQMTKAVGIEMTRPFSASEALWTLYNAVNKSTDLVSEASRALVRRNLGFDSQTLEMEKEARDGVRFRTVGNASANAQASMYNRGAASARTRLKESFVDMHASVEELVKAIEKRSGKVAEGFENILMALNQQASKGLAAMEEYERKFLNKMFDEIRKIMDKTNFKYEDIVRYVILKHGLERNEKMAQRDAKAHYQEIYDDIIAKIKGMNPAQKRTYLTNAQLRDADAKAELAVLQGVNTSALTPDQLRDHKKALAKAKKEAAEAAEHLVRAQKIATMTEQDAQDELDKIFKKIEKGTDSVYKEMRKNDYSGISSMFYDTLGVDRKNYATEEEYQAALMQAKADKYDNLGDIEGAAQMEVTLFENAVNTDKLWKSINKATKETLRQQYEANMISKDQYENLRNMFEFYVPLRGFADNTAEDMYTYYRRPNSTGYTKPILGAEGRKTEAESPFGWIAAMAGSAIASNVKNEAKLALYYFVANRPDNGIATLSKTWFVHTPGDVDANGKKIFRPAYPPFNEDLSSASAKADYEIWQANMKNLQAQGLAYEAGQRLNLGNSVVNISDTNKPEHIVNVKVGGKDYTIVINGNPRAAQAINGDLNIESSAQDYSTVFGPMLRWMSSVNTSYNPEFWITNMMRDMAFTLMAVNIKGDPAYRRKFFKNYAKAFKVISMVAKNEKGTLGNKYIENMYKDFVKYGGVTGYTQIKDSETWEKEIENYLTSNDPASIRNGKVMRGVKSVFHAAHRFGESLEQVSRFAAFLTAMETGKSINEAINDAKEITVNFNRKGSGKMITLEEAKYLTDKNGQPLNKLEQWAAVGLSSIAPLGRRMIMFFNAAIQGLNATYKLYAKDKTRAIGWALGYAAVGMINAVLHAMLDDDDDYLDIPQYERRNSLMIGWNGAYIKWALPQEARAFYALGDLAVESVMGRNPHQNVIGEALKISTEILPVNPSEGWKAFMPSVAIPFVELALNEDYKGAPIYNEQKWLTEEERKRSTKWSKAYSGTGDLYIGIAKVLNAVTGGDEHDAGLINLQPEKMEHLVQSAFGGTIRTADKFINTIMAAFDPEEDVTVRQFPFLNRILTINDERYKNVHVNDVYDYYAAEAEHALTLKKKYEKDKDKESYNKLLKSDEYKWATIYSKYKKPVKKYQEAIRAADTTKERMELMKQQDELKRKMIKEISDL